MAAAIAMASIGLDDDEDDEDSPVKTKKRTYSQAEIDRGNKNKKKFHDLVDSLVSQIVPRLTGEIHRLNGENKEIQVGWRTVEDRNYRIVVWCEHACFKLEFYFLHRNLLDDDASIRLRTTLSCHEESDKKLVPFFEKEFEFKCTPGIALETISASAVTLHQYITETSKRIVLYDALQSIDGITAWTFVWSKKHATMCLGFTGTVKWLHLELCISDIEDVVLLILYNEWYLLNPSKVDRFTMNCEIRSKQEFIQFINGERGIKSLKSQLLEFESRIDALQLTT